jgi:hypothetical protein
MYPPRVPDDEHGPTAGPRTWGGLAAAAVATVVIPVALWIASDPLPGVVVLGTVALAVAAASVTGDGSSATSDGSDGHEPVRPTRREGDDREPTDDTDAVVSPEVRTADPSTGTRP